MRVGIDARMWAESGIGRYIKNLITQLEKIDKVNEYYILLRKPDYDRLVYNTKNFKKVLADFGWYDVTEQIQMPRLLSKYQLDLVHSPHFNVPLFYKGKFIVTIHDLIHDKFEMRRATTHDPIIYKLKHWGYKKVFSHAIKNSVKIIAVSNYVKDELIERWGVEPKKIVVTHEAVEGQLIAIVARLFSKDVTRILAKFHIRKPYIFYVGNAHPHKNVEGLIKVFLNLRKNYQYLQLVLSGSDHYFWGRIKKEFMDSRLRGNDRRVGDIIFTGYVSDEELVALYKGAKCFVLPSFEEGFGLPLLEAFACGIPVVSSNAGSLKEIGGDACLYFDPHDIEDMSAKIRQVLESSKIRDHLMEKGSKRYRDFSWERLAKETLKVYKNESSS